jgi:glucokinase
MSANIEVDGNLITGLDIGGTKVQILDSYSDTVRHVLTHDFPDLYAVLDDYFAAIGGRPRHIAVAIAGPRDENTGAVKITNSPWPVFNPVEAAVRYPGTTFETYNDMNAAAAGVAVAHSDNFLLIKEGKASAKGNKAAVAISTGFGVGIAAYNRSTDGYTLIDCEMGHSGFQPYTEVQNKFLQFLYTKYSDPSWDLAITGGFGIDNWLEFLYDKIHAPKLGGALEKAFEAGRPPGAVLLEFATEGVDEDREAARTILEYMADLTATALSNVALTYKTTGGIYLTGSVSLALSEYWVEQTKFKKAFIRKGSEGRAEWLEEFCTNVPIYLVTDPHIGVKGALVLAEQS